MDYSAPEWGIETCSSCHSWQIEGPCFVPLWLGNLFCSWALSARIINHQSALMSIPSWALCHIKPQAGWLMWKAGLWQPFQKAMEPPYQDSWPSIRTPQAWFWVWYIGEWEHVLISRICVEHCVAHAGPVFPAPIYNMVGNACFQNAKN